MISSGAPITTAVKLASIRALIGAKQDWLERFSSGKAMRPAHEIDAKRQELTILRTIAEDYERIA